MPATMNTSRTPNAAISQPAKDIAEIVLFLASEESSMINGEVLVADAAWSAY